MSRLLGLKVLVAGAGALGSAVAWRLQRGGAQVVLADPSDLGDNASGIAAGMLAPAFEAVLDPASAGHFLLLKAARDLWPAFVAELAAYGGEIERCGALWVGDAASRADVLDQLGASAETLDGRGAEALSRGLRAPAGAVFTPEDWRLEPRAMLSAIRKALLSRGGEVIPSGLREVAAGLAYLADGRTVAVDQVVLATGMAPVGMTPPVPELAWLAPIKGQIARLSGAGPSGGPVIRAPGVYLVPSSDGLIIGATMEPGLADRRVETAALERLLGLASPLFADLARARISGEAGVRAATPDALPLAGRSSRPGVLLAMGARRNGWLLAPLVAEIIEGQLAGEPPGRWAAMLDPRRFSPPV